MKYLRYIVLASLFFSVMCVVPGISAASPATTPITQEKPAPAVMDVEPSPLVAGIPQKVEYALPYPGILPDHPLYFFKKVRDQILEKLIADPLRKIEFYILQSDKAVSSSIFLATKNKNTPALQMAAGSLEYKKRALSIAKQLKTEGKELPVYVVERVQKSFAKHIEVLTDFQADLSGDQKAELTRSLDAVKKLQTEAGLLK